MHKSGSSDKKADTTLIGECRHCFFIAFQFVIIENLSLHGLILRFNLRTRITFIYFNSVARKFFQFVDKIQCFKRSQGVDVALSQLFCYFTVGHILKRNVFT